LADLPALVKISPWNEGTFDGISEATAAEYWKALRTRQRENQVKVPKDNCNCKCGEFETVQHIVKHCQRTILKRGPGISPTVKYTKRAPSYEGAPLVKQTQLKTAHTRWVFMPYSNIKRVPQALSQTST
jgi:hypothetical protein